MRPIDADAVETKIQILLCEVEKHGFTPPEQIVNLGLFLQLINKAPTIEVKPVVHACWKHDSPIDCYYCSNCGEGALRDYFEYEVRSKYCPCCGAQMDEVVSDTNVGSKMDEPFPQAYENDKKGE